MPFPASVRQSDVYKRQVYAYEFAGSRYDVGDKKGFLQAQIDFALAREDLRETMIEIIRSTGIHLSLIHI